MRKKKITSLDVVKNFYLSHELIKKHFELTSKTQTRKFTTVIEFKSILKKSIKQLEKTDNKTLMKYTIDRDSRQHDNFYNSKWELREINLADCGLWPRFGGLPHEFCEGNVSDCANMIQPLLSEKNLLSAETGRLLFIEELTLYVKELVEATPIIVVEDNIIRHNKLRSEAVRNSYVRTKYDIQDGSHRAVALALLGHTKVKSMVGKRVYKNPLLY